LGEGRTFQNAADFPNFIARMPAARTKKIPPHRDESEERFRLLFELSADAILLLDGRTNEFVDCNEATVRMLRAKSKAQVFATHPSKLSPKHQPDGRPSDEKADEMIAAAIREGSHRFEWMHRRMDGEDFMVEVLLTSVQLGQQPLIVTVWREIGERKRMEEEALRESDRRFRLLFERSADPILLLDSKAMCFTDCNPAAVALMRGKDKSCLVGHSPWDIAPVHQPSGKASRDHALELLSKLGSGGAERFEWTHSRVDGTEFPVEVMLTAMEIGDVCDWVVVWREISERKRVEAELQRNLARERELNDLKSSFVSMVSHEFRTPLGIILFSAELLSNHLDRLSADKRTQQLQSIRESTLHMSRLIDEVLLLGKVEAGQLKFTPSPLDLPLFCRHLADEMLSATKRVCPIELRVGRLPAAAEGDEALLRHVFSNLLSNAVKYSPAGTPVRFAIAREGADAVFTISDRGIGIPEGDRAHIFGAFQRAKNVGNIEGSGLGLVIVKRCVDLQGGRLTLESRVGQGTTVTVRLPMFSETKSRALAAAGKKKKTKTRS
jgi:PAS domain S-box-containing protein